MDNAKPSRYKPKNKKPAPKPKTTKKRKSDGPTCSMFLAELTRKLALKRKQEEELPVNIVQTIIDSLTNALPIRFSRKSPPKKESPMKIETLQTFAPELLPNDTLTITQVAKFDTDEASIQEVEVELPRPPVTSLKIPRMPIINSDVIKTAVEKTRKLSMQDEAVNTGTEHDVASEIAKHVSTLRKISLIAEEFNQKTAKNLKEIVDSVQEDLIKKLEEIQAEQKAKASKSSHVEGKIELAE